MAILTFIPTLFGGVHEIFLQYDSGGVNVLHQNHPQSLAESVVVLVGTKVPPHLSRPLASSVETRTGDVAGHEVPDIYNTRHYESVHIT